MELFTLSNQWATRPDDERFTSLDEMYAATKQYAAAAQEKTVPWSDLRVEAVGRDIHLIGRADVPAVVTNYAFGQLAARVGAPAQYLRALPGTLAAQNLNFGLKARIESKSDASLLFHTNGRLVLRAVTTEKYSRLWNYEVLERLLGFADRHDLVPVRPTFTWDGRTVDQLDPKQSTGLFASDHDMVLGLMSRERVIDDGASALYRTLLVENSEVGDKSFRVTFAMVRDVCGNLILWGATDVLELSFPHIGDVAAKWGDVQVHARRFLEQNTDGERRLIIAAQSKRLGMTRDEVLDALFGRRQIRLSRKTLEAAYDAVVPAQDGDPRTVWGFVQGLTRYSQQAAGRWADQRLDMDRAGRRILELVDF